MAHMSPGWSKGCFASAESGRSALGTCLKGSDVINTVCIVNAQAVF